MLACAKELVKLGHQTTSAWLLEHFQPGRSLTHYPPGDLAGMAMRDLGDIRRADALLHFTDEVPASRGGNHAEYGYALRCEMPIIVVGPRTHIFHYLPSVQQFDSWAKA